MNARERVRQALLCRKPDKIPKALGFFDQSLAAIAPTRPENYFDLDVRFAEFDPPDNQDDFRHYMANLPADIHVGSRAQLRTYHEWQYHPEKGTARPLSQHPIHSGFGGLCFSEFIKTGPPRRTHQTGEALACPGAGCGRLTTPFGRRIV